MGPGWGTGRARYVIGAWRDSMARRAPCAAPAAPLARATATAPAPTASTAPAFVPVTYAPQSPPPFPLTCTVTYAPVLQSLLAPFFRLGPIVSPFTPSPASFTVGSVPSDPALLTCVAPQMYLFVHNALLSIEALGRNNPSCPTHWSYPTETAQKKIAHPEISSSSRSMHSISSSVFPLRAALNAESNDRRRYRTRNTKQLGRFCLCLALFWR